MKISAFFIISYQITFKTKKSFYAFLNHPFPNFTIFIGIK